eukprot:TRINITY_DN816_c0_g2_i4.p1 TRINITY_DN816_c0_g2~~TRINITY_DN816_c0_g2_i4.p1  ORF type:complete len:216 (-),score=35.33 TRINITY_DN816_c0_g2_i4:277-924(-)
MTSEAEIALKTFEIENDITEGDDEIYFYSQEENNKETSQKPWLHDPEHYKHVKISALALIKMVMHARSGGDIEVMGLMQGKVKGDTMIVMDAYALPVQATETRVNAAAEAYEYMAEYNTVSKEVTLPIQSITCPLHFSQFLKKNKKNKRDFFLSFFPSCLLFSRSLSTHSRLVSSKQQVGRLENVLGWYHSHPGNKISSETPLHPSQIHAPVFVD